MKQSMMKLWSQIIQSSMSQASLTYSSVVNFLNRLDGTCELAFMITSKDKYYKKMCKTLTD